MSCCNCTGACLHGGGCAGWRSDSPRWAPPVHALQEQSRLTFEAFELPRMLAYNGDAVLKRYLPEHGTWMPVQAALSFDGKRWEPMP